MTPNFRNILQILAAVIIVVVLTVFMTGCSNTMAVLDGATHACGNVHIEGFYTDTQGDVIVAKAPDNWTPEQVKEFCAGAQ